MLIYGVDAYFDCYHYCMPAVSFWWQTTSIWSPSVIDGRLVNVSVPYVNPMYFLGDPWFWWLYPTLHFCCCCSKVFLHRRWIHMEELLQCVGCSRSCTDRWYIKVNSRKHTKCCSNSGWTMWVSSLWKLFG